MRGIFYAVWSYRYFIISSIKTDFKSRFARSKLGFLWMVLHPLAQVLIYALILSAIISSKLPGIDSQYAYAIYLLAGNLIKKMAFPKMTLPFIVVGTALVNFSLLFVTMFIVFGLLGHIAISAILWLPLLIIITLGLAIGIGLSLGTINVFLRDVGQIMTIILQFWFWLTPIVYVITIVPQKYHNLLYINPMVGVIEGYHNVLVYDKAPDLEVLIYPSIVAILTLILAFFLFKKANADMADLL